jgi:quinol monooxygenase YgiN
MYARVTSVQIQPGKMEEAIRITDESIIPVVRQQHGFLGFTQMIDRTTGNVRFITRFETEASMQAGFSNGFMQQQLAKLATVIVAGTATSEAYEVLAHE